MEQKYWEDFSVGQKVTTQAVTVTETHLVNWAGLTMDFYPFHVDEEYAKNTPFKGRVAHGPLTMAMACGLVAMTGVYGDSLIAWLGAENMRIPLPVRIGDTIHVDAEVVEARETKNPGRGVVKFKFDVKNQNNETVMNLDWVLMMRRRP